VGLIWALVIPDISSETRKEGTRTHIRCPDCAELILREAKVCKHCGRKQLQTESIKGAEYLSEQELESVISKLQGKDSK
jgi:predicted amidophosphoribosyltransferase